MNLDTLALQATTDSNPGPCFVDVTEIPSWFDLRFYWQIFFFYRRLLSEKIFQQNELKNKV